MCELCTITCHQSRHCLTSRRVTSSRSFTKRIYKRAGRLVSLTIRTDIFLRSLLHTFKRYSIDSGLKWNWGAFFCNLVKHEFSGSCQARMESECVLSLDLGSSCTASHNWCCLLWICTFGEQRIFIKPSQETAVICLYFLHVFLLNHCRVSQRPP